MSDDAPEPYHVYQAREDVRLPWHGGENGRRWNEAMGLMKDSFADAATIAARSRLISMCPADALDLHGASLKWPQAPGETTDEYRARLLRSPHLEEWRGTNTGIIDAIAGILNNVVSPTLARPTDWVEIYESFTPGWGRHTGVAEHARWFNVIIRQPHPFGTDFSFKWGDGTTWGSGKLYGVNGDPRLLEVIRQSVRRQKSKHSICESIAIVLAGNVKHTNAADDGDPTPGSKVAYLTI